MDDEIPVASPIPGSVHRRNNRIECRVDLLSQEPQPIRKRRAADTSAAPRPWGKPSLSTIRHQVREADVVGPDRDQDESDPLLHCDRLQPINLGGQTNGSTSVRRQIDVTGSCTRTSQVDPAGERGRHHLDCSAVGAMACCGRALPIHTAWANFAPPPTRNAEAVGSIRRWTAAPCVAKPPTCLAGYEAVAECNCGPGVLISRNMRSGRLGRREQDGRNRATDPNLDPAGPE